VQWYEDTEALRTTFRFESQVALAQFVLDLARHSDAVHHHADMEIRYNVLHLSLSTHDAGNCVTEKDHALKRFIEAEVSRRSM
jgi:4a-hydroxytetrahydrobiopterin dehydratase